MSESKRKMSLSRVYFHASENLRRSGSGELTEKQITELLSDLRSQISAEEVYHEFCEGYNSFERVEVLGLSDLLFNLEDDLCLSAIEEVEEVKHLIMCGRIHHLSHTFNETELWKRYSEGEGTKEVYLVVDSDDYCLTQAKVFLSRHDAEEAAGENGIIFKKEAL